MKLHAEATAYLTDLLVGHASVLKAPKANLNGEEARKGPRCFERPCHSPHELGTPLGEQNMKVRIFRCHSLQLLKPHPVANEVLLPSGTDLVGCHP